MITPDTTGAGARKVTPLSSQCGDIRSVESEQNAAAAFSTISGMENSLATIRDLGIAVSTMAQGISGLQDDHAGALNRLGMLIVEHLDTAEAARGDAFGQLHRYAHPNSEAQS